MAGIISSTPLSSAYRDIDGVRYYGTPSGSTTPSGGVWGVNQYGYYDPTQTPRQAAESIGEIYTPGSYDTGGYGGGTTATRTGSSSGGGSYSGSGIVSDSGAGGGDTPLSRSAYEAQQAAQLQAKLQAEAEARRLASIQSMSGHTSGHVTRDAGIDPNEAAARATAFGRAKELAGNNALAAVNALNDVFAGRGLHGSTIEGGEIGKAVAGGRADVNSYITKQLIEDLNRAADVADTTYQGNITQRGQDLNQQQTLLGLIAGRAY